MILKAELRSSQGLVFGQHYIAWRGSLTMDENRVPKSLGSMWTSKTTSHTGNGRRMRLPHFLRETSVCCLAANSEPTATDISLDDWNRDSHPMKKNQFGVFELVLPAKDGQPAIGHNSKVKVGVLAEN
jgi:hypothetical protein